MNPVRDNATAALASSLIADSLALGAHWIYDTTVIAEVIGRVDQLLAPKPDSYHKNRGAGDFTHYGDQTFVLLESVAACDGFSLQDFYDRWRLLFAQYDGYVDGATRNTLSRIDFGEGPKSSGSNSSDLAGAARIAPLVLRYRDDIEALVQAAREQTRMTHNNPQIIDAAEFFARTSHNVLHGASPTDAMHSAAKATNSAAPIASWLQQGLGLAQAETVDAVAQFGQSCNVEGALPAVVQIIARHQDNLKEALVQNTMAGGDSAARGLLVGLVLGAALGPQALPEAWGAELSKGQAMKTLADSLS